MGLKKGSPDIIIFFTTILLLSVGIIMVFSASYYDTLEKDPYFYVRKQMTWGLISLAAMVLMMKIDYFRLKPHVNIVFLITLVLLILVLVPGVGVEVKGSRRWINLGFTNLQPSEVMKLCLVLFLSKSLGARSRRIKHFFTGLGPYLLLLSLIGALIMMEPDLGTTLAISATTVIMLFAAGVRWLHIIFLGISGLAVGAALILQEPYRWNRIVGYLDPWAHASKEGYQTINSLYALGSGGFFGMGLGNSRQKLDFLPEQHTDFIFAILGEELGFLGAFFVILLFLLLAWRGYRIALTCPDVFGSFLAVGITTMIVFQAFINMGVVTGLLPVTGISLPFISYGGSSLLFSMLGIGILLNISRYTGI
ncbi:MAG: putative lipid II flippase FtsW [Peptococcaceae bacterium]|jgi:cell division protein FtsW|nr:putative lipid II flippase FtsW [Peptococcaceae bacterium]MDH7524357.1 putative lipid II flippase FtsW [Peptococcaceae bacterium]